MKRAHKKHVRKLLHYRDDICLKYELYDIERVLDIEHDPIYISENPFEVIGHALNQKGPCSIIRYMGRLHNNILNISAIQTFNRSNFMQVVNDNNKYWSTILYADSASEFFTPSAPQKFNIWEVTISKKITRIVDFTLQYDGIMIISMFGNRLRIPLTKNPKQIPENQIQTAKYSAKYAIIYNESIEKFSVR